jgi:hypothetical protein
MGEPNTEAETLIPCPVCKKGLVPISVATSVKEALAKAHDGPETSEVAHLKR